MAVFFCSFDNVIHVVKFYLLTKNIMYVIYVFFFSILRLRRFNYILLHVGKIDLNAGILCDLRPKVICFMKKVSDLL